jgi:hypothetical protein
MKMTWADPMLAGAWHNLKSALTRRHDCTHAHPDRAARGHAACSLFERGERLPSFHEFPMPEFTEAS